MTDMTEEQRRHYEECANCNHCRITFEKLDILEYQLGLQPQVKDAICDLDNEITHKEDWCSYWEGPEYEFDEDYDKEN